MFRLAALGSLAMSLSAGALAVDYSVDAGAGPVARYIDQEAARYFGKLFTNGANRTGAFEDARIVIGTVRHSEALARLAGDGVIELPEGPNAAQGYCVKNVEGRIVVAGLTDAGALYGLYAMLEAYGCYFQISGERLPEPAPFEAIDVDLRQEPVFAYRGLLPWDNFLCGMSGYNLEDYKLLLERAARMKFNKLQFHFYPGLVYFTETVNGDTTEPEFVGAPVDVFKTEGAVGGEAFGDIERFAPRPYVEHIGKPRAQAEACQAMMREALDYAKQLGFTTVVGFELMHPPVGGTYTDKPEGGLNILNPLDHENVELSLQRYQSLVETYPGSDYYWMWQSEARGILSAPVGREPGAAEMREAYAHWAGHEAYPGDIDYAYLFDQVVRRLTPGQRARTATGGWTVEHLFPGYGREAPPEVTFASLNVYLPRTAIEHMRFYEAAESERPTWMIEWWEFDGEQWFPQWRASWQETMYRRAMEAGLDSVTLLGWKLSAVEHNVRYLADFAWEPLPAEEFYRDYVARLYGEAAAPLAERYVAHDAMAPDTPPATPGDDRRMLLGAGWMALVIPPVPHTSEGLDEDQWRHTVKRAREIMVEQRELRGMDAETAAAMEEALPKLDETGRSWARLMKNRLEFRMKYVDSMLALNAAYPLYDETARQEGLDAAAQAAARKAAEALELSKDAVRHYAQDIRNRNDLGVVAQLNEQYVDSIANFISSLGVTESPYVTLDWEALRVLPEVAFDFSGEAPWTPRDGEAAVWTETQDGEPTLVVELGGDGTPFHSVHVHPGEIRLEEAPLLDFEVRAEPDAAPVAFLMQAGAETTWRAFNLVGQQSRYPQLDRLPRGALADGEWRRVTWDMARAIGEQLAPGRPVVHNIIFGSWEEPRDPVRVEFRNVSFCKRRTLD